ncbi:MAG: coenzyme F420-0:L-glutamate ligase [Acidimicrobiia bacterium]
MLTCIPVPGIPEITPGTVIGDAIVDAAMAAGITVEHHDCFVVTQKIVSKAEDRLVAIDASDPDAKKRLVRAESTRIIRERGPLLISETQHGFICANAGIDLSNVDAGTAALLPVDPDRSAQRIRERIAARTQTACAVIVSDTFGRAWRMGLTDVAIGVAGIRAILDLRGTPDDRGRTLEVTEVAIADEIAGAAELVMGKATHCPVAIVRGLDPGWFGDGRARDLIRPAQEDLFR